MDRNLVKRVHQTFTEDDICITYNEIKKVIDKKESDNSKNSVQEEIVDSEILILESNHLHEMKLVFLQVILLQWDKGLKKEKK